MTSSYNKALDVAGGGERGQAISASDSIYIRIPLRSWNEVAPPTSAFPAGAVGRSVVTATFPWVEASSRATVAFTPFSKDAFFINQVDASF